MNSNQEISEFEKLYEKVEAFGTTSFELAKLKSLEVTSSVASSLVNALSIAGLAMLFFILLNFGVALWLGDLLGKSYYGFFTVACFYLLLGLVFYFFFGKRIKNAIGKLIITKALS